MSWLWQYLWWNCFGAASNARLLLLTARDPIDKLIGIAPFMQLRSKSRRLIPARQLAPIGNVWRLNDSEVTEHIDWIIDREHETEVSSAFADTLAGAKEWHEILFSYTPTDSLAAESIGALADRLDCYVRLELPLPHYTVDTSVSFEAFLKSLGKHTRNRLFGRRKLLNDLGVFREVVADNSNIGEQLDKLDSLSQKRWRTGFSTASREFFERLSADLLCRKALRFATLEVDDRPISALYDVEAQGVVYNIRSAIDTAFHPRLSPGLLHLGLAIERSCARESIKKYALLAGGGKNSDYKRDFTEPAGHFKSMQLVRRRHEKIFYRLYDLARSLFR